VSRAWVSHPERGSPLALHLMRWIALRLGRAPARVLLYPITLYYLLLAPRGRHASRAYLRRVLGRRPHWRESARHFHSFGATILDRVYLLTGQLGRLEVRVHGAELLEPYLQSGRGCILLGAHLGSFELLRALCIDQRELRLKVLMDAAQNETITRLLHALAPAVAETVLPLRRPEDALLIQNYLEQGYLIGMLGDRVTDPKRVVECDFLGGRAAFPTGPLLVASILRAPILLFFGLYRGGNRYEVHFEAFADAIRLDRTRRDADLAAWVQRYADAVARHAEAAPYNWFNFYDFWADGIDSP
jgi:predicted LPLAT superfamily acyltransferase